MICKLEKTTILEAIRFDGSKESFDEIRAWVGDQFYYDYQQLPFVFLGNDTCSPVFVNNWIVKEQEQFRVMTDADISYFKKLPQDKEAIFKKAD